MAITVMREVSEFHCYIIDLNCLQIIGESTSQASSLSQLSQMSVTIPLHHSG
jgi:hypothetical protein